MKSDKIQNGDCYYNTQDGDFDLSIYCPENIKRL